MPEVDDTAPGEEKGAGGANPLDALTRGAQRWFRYQGGSMWPYFQTGDLLVTAPVAAASLRSGDCIVYQPPDGDHFIVHRIVRTAPELWTRGDARPAIDDRPVDPDRIVGRVDTRIRYGRQRRVASGMRGRIVGKVYPLLGKLDPSRATRGGKVARLLQQIARPLVGGLMPGCRLVTFEDERQGQVELLVWRGRVIGRYSPSTRYLGVLWPYSVILSSVQGLSNANTCAYPDTKYK